MINRPYFWCIAAFCFFFPLVFAVYWPTLHGEFISDDHAFIKDNPHIKDVRNIPSFFTDRTTISAKKDWGTIYRPLRTTTYAIEFYLWELDPKGYHLVNIALHAINVFLLFCLLRRFCLSGPMAMLIGTLFAVHPVHTEVVAWVSSRGDLLYLLFFLAGFLLFIKSVSYLRAEWFRFAIVYSLSLGSFLCGLFSKEMIVSLPPLLVLWALLLADKGKRRPAVLLTIPFFLLVVAYLVFKFIVLENTSKYGFHGGSYWITVLSMSPVFYHYIKLLFYPHPLIFCYFGIPLTRTVMSIGVWTGLLLLIGLLFLAVFFFRKKRPEITFFILWFLISFAPVSNLLVPLNTLMAERFLYLPSIGFIAGLTLIVHAVFRQRWSRNSAFVAACLVIAVFMTLVIQRNIQWIVPETLFKHDVEHWPRTILSRYGLVEIYKARGQYQQARELLTPLREWYPKSVDAWAALADLDVAEMKLEDAEKKVRYGLTLDPENEVLHNLCGLINKKRNRTEAAIVCFNRALAVNPRYVEALNNLAGISIDRQRYIDAEAFIRKALLLNRHNVTVLENAANFAIRQGDLVSAEHYLDQRRRVAAHNHLSLFLQGNLEERKRDSRRALLYWQHSIAHGMKDPMVLFNIGTALLTLHNPHQSIRYFETLFREHPDFHLSKNNWCIALYQTGRAREAVLILEQQLELTPQDPNLRRNLELMTQQ